MLEPLYNYFVKKNPNIQYEYERYVMEHIQEHYLSKWNHWKVLWSLNVHYRIKKNTEPLIYRSQPFLNNGFTSLLVEQNASEWLYPALYLYESIVFGKEEGAKLFLCPYSGTGDVYLAGMYMKDYMNSNGIDDYVVAVIGEGNMKVASLYGFDNIVNLSQKDADGLIRLAMFLGEDNKDIVIMHHDAPQVYFGILENFRNINSINFTDLFVNVVFGHAPGEGVQMPQFRRDRQEICRLMDEYGLERNKTVVLSPYAKTLTLLPEWVWVQLAEELKKHGFSVVTNCGNSDEEPVYGTQGLCVPYNLSVPFLEECGYFIGIRSGLCDVISTARCRKIIIYQPYLFWGDATNYDYFSLNKIGFCDDAIELQYEGVAFLDLIDDIMDTVFIEETMMFEKEVCREKNMKNNKHIKHIIVQAGGKGTRMGELTRNKPKALVPIGNRPMLFHLFDKFPDAHFIIIGDYQIDVLRRYLEAFAEIEYDLVDARGKSGTCAGIRSSLEYVPENEPLMLIWSDLLLSNEFVLEDVEGGNYVGLSDDFACRWKYENGVFEEQQSQDYGVAGLFSFVNKDIVSQVPVEGEFVRWLSGKDIEFKTVKLLHAKEYGLKEEYDKLRVSKCRPFNSIESYRGTVIKRPVDSQGELLAQKEIQWYKSAQKRGYSAIPKILSYSPLIMEQIEGKNVYEYNELSHVEKSEILHELVSRLKDLHSLDSTSFNQTSFEDAYIDKTLKRLERVKELVPYGNEAYINVNGKRCRNIFYHIEEVKELLERYKPSKYVFIHGDCTFSNMLLRDGVEPVLIDPRGYFGKTELYGDEAYDWAKLYYSLVGNYDQFNLKRFELEFINDGVLLTIDSSGWEDMEDLFFELIGDSFTRTHIKLIHSIIWLSLTTYAWENYDSICGAFYNGLYYLEDVL